MSGDDTLVHKLRKIYYLRRSVGPLYRLCDFCHWGAQWHYITYNHLSDPLDTVECVLRIVDSEDISKILTAKSISIVPFIKYTQFGLTRFTSGVHR